MNSRLQKALVDYASHPKFNFIRVVEFGHNCFGAEEYTASSVEQYEEHIHNIASDLKLPFANQVRKDAWGIPVVPVRQIHSVKISFCDYNNCVPILEEHAVGFFEKSLAKIHL
jgi:hypothetical protein